MIDIAALRSQWAVNLILSFRHSQLKIKNATVRSSRWSSSGQAGTRTKTILHGNTL